MKTLKEDLATKNIIAIQKLKDAMIKVKSKSEVINKLKFDIRKSIDELNDLLGEVNEAAQVMFLIDVKRKKTEWEN